MNISDLSSNKTEEDSFELFIIILYQIPGQKEAEYVKSVELQRWAVNIVYFLHQNFFFF